MKQFLLFLGIFLLFCIPESNAQTFTYTMDSLLTHLNKSLIPTGILYDRAYPIAGVHLFNSLEPDTANNRYFNEAYAELFLSAYNQTNWIVSDTINARIAAARAIGQVPIGVSFYAYNMIDTNATTNNLIQMHSDSLYYDTPGRTISPYDTFNTMVASPLLDSINTNAAAVTFSFPSNLFINHSSLTLSTFKVDFGDGAGLLTLGIGSTHSVTYSSPDGYRKLKFVITMSNNVVYTTYGKVKIYNTAGKQLNSTKTAASVNSTGCYTPTFNKIKNAGSFMGYDETSASTNQGSMQIQYATNTCTGKLMNPIFIVDAFDPTDDASTITPAGLYYQYNNFIYHNAGFLDYLRSQGYDIVTMTYDPMTGKARYGGTDYIERNGKVVIAALTYLRDLLTQNKSTSKIILIGPSMGGLVCQYALTTMEQAGTKHNVGLWVAFDTPFLGANAPLGDQQFVNYLSLLPQASQALSIYANNPAAKQMLINHYLANASGPGGAPGFRDRFVSEMNTLGYPVGDAGQSFRKIALVDGSLGGNETNSSCQKALAFYAELSGTLKVWIFKFRYRFPVAKEQVNFTPSAGNTCELLHATAFYKLPQITHFTTPSYTSGYDTAPGGTYNFTQKIQDQGTITPTSSSGGLRTYFSDVVNIHSFVSTKSALGFIGSNKNLSENIGGRNLVCSHETPFDSYYGSLNTNQTHITLWTGAMDWLVKECNGIPQPPSIAIQTSNCSVSGPVTLCGPSTYSITNIPAGATVVWSALPSSSVTLTPSGQTVTATSVSSGAFSLSAIVTSNCVSSTATSLNIQSGNPTPQNISAFLKNMGGFYNIIFSTAYGTGYTWAWTVNGVATGGNSSSCTVRVPACPASTSYSVSVKVTNSCGITNECGVWQYNCSPSSSITNTSNCTGGGGGVESIRTSPVSDFVATDSLSSKSGLSENKQNKVYFYPNPADKTLILSTRNGTSPDAVGEAITQFTYQIFNQKGKVLKSGASDGSDVSIDTSTLQNDIYIIHIKANNMMTEKILLIKHK